MQLGLSLRASRSVSSSMLPKWFFMTGADCFVSAPVEEEYQCKNVSIGLGYYRAILHIYLEV